MSKRIVRKTIQGKQTYKESAVQTKLPTNQTVTRNGPTFLEQGANLLGLTNVNPLLKLGANVLADVCDDYPRQNPIQKMKKDDTNPIKQSIETQVQNVQKQVQDIVKENVKIREVLYPDIEPVITTSNDSKTVIQEKSRWVPCISKEVVVDIPAENKKPTKTKTIQGKFDPKSFAHNRRQQMGREQTMKQRNIRPIFPIPYPEVEDNPYKDL